jgi:hypothetical protein
VGHGLGKKLNVYKGKEAKKTPKGKEREEKEQKKKQGKEKDVRGGDGIGESRKLDMDKERETKEKDMKKKQWENEEVRGGVWKRGWERFQAWTSRGRPAY